MKKFNIFEWGKTERTLLVISFFTLLVTIGSFLYFSNELEEEDNSISNIESMLKDYEKGDRTDLQTFEDYKELQADYANNIGFIISNREDIENKRMFISGAFGLITLCLISCIAIRKPWKQE